MLGWVHPSCSGPYTQWGLSQSAQLLLFFKTQYFLFTLSFVDKHTNTDWFHLLENLGIS